METDALIPYENITGGSAEMSIHRADEAIRNGWSLGKEQPLIRFGERISWEDNDLENRTWMFNLHSLDMLEDLLLAHSETNGPEYIESALLIAMDWVRNYPFLDEDSNSPSFAWYDMAVGLRAIRLSYIADVAERSNVIDSEALDLLHASLEQHRIYLHDDANIAFHSNHGFYQVLGQLAMSRRFRGRLEGMEEAYSVGQVRLRKLVHIQFTEEGVHREHSPDYHRMVYESFRGIAKAGLCESQEFLGFLDKIESALAWFVYPDGILVNLGDSDSRDMNLSVRSSGNRWHESAMQYVASKGQAGASPAEDLMSFDRSGYAIARPGWSCSQDDAGYLALIGAFHSRTHKHADDLSLVWYDRGASIFVDSGRYGYYGKTLKESPDWLAGFWYSDPQRMYVEKTRAHNAVEIDGKDYPRRGVAPYGSAIRRSGKTQDGIYYMEGEARHFGNIRHARMLVWMPGSWMITFDWMQDAKGESHDFRQWWNFAPSFSVENIPGGYLGCSREIESPLALVSLLRGVVSPEELSLGDEETLQGNFSPSGKFIFPIYSGAFLAQGVSSSFVTLASFDLPEERGRNATVAPSGRSFRAKWIANGFSHDIAVTRLSDSDISIIYQKAPSA